MAGPKIVRAIGAIAVVMRRAGANSTSVIVTFLVYVYGVYSAAASIVEVAAKNVSWLCGGGFVMCSTVGHVSSGDAATIAIVADMIVW